MPPAVYATVLLFPALAALGLWMAGPLVWLMPLVTFGALPIVELWLAPLRGNRTDEAEARAERAYIWIARALVAAQWGLVGLFLHRYSSYAAGWELAGAIVTLGIACGAFGINVGHELGHRVSKLDLFLAKTALASSLYVHFYIEHNRGHHAKVSTPEDPVFSPRGCTVFGHWVRAVPGTWMEAWRLEAARLARKGLRPWSWRNEHLRLQLAQAALVAAIFLLAGPQAGVGWLAAGAIGVLLLETVNYIEHYGLSRRKLDDGRYERVQPLHSWNSDHPLGRVLLLDLSRHSDHHANPGRPYPLLRSFPEAPQFPTGYPGMIVLALFPPAFFAIMHPRLAAWEAGRSGGPAGPREGAHGPFAELDVAAAPDVVDQPA
jgi:alkane 1-monooxygenase